MQIDQIVQCTHKQKCIIMCSGFLNGADIVLTNSVIEFVEKVHSKHPELVQLITFRVVERLLPTFPNEGTKTVCELRKN